MALVFLVILMGLLSIPQRLLATAVILLLFYFGLPFVKDLYDGRVIKKSNRVVQAEIDREIKKQIKKVDVFIGDNSNTDYVARVLDDGAIKSAGEGVSKQGGDTTLFEETPDADADKEDVSRAFANGELGDDDELLLEQGETSILSLESCGWLIIGDELIYNCGGWQ